MSVLCSRARGWLLSPTMLVLRRHHGAIGTPVADLAECAKEAALPSVDLCLRLRTLLRLLHLDDEDRVTLAVLPSFQVDVDVVNLVVALDDGCSGRTLSFEAHNLRSTPIKLVLGLYLLLLHLHLLRDVIVGNGAVVRGEVAIFQYGLQDRLGKTYAIDGALPQDGLSVHGNAQAVVDISVVINERVLCFVCVLWWK